MLLALLVLAALSARPATASTERATGGSGPHHSHPLTVWAVNYRGTLRCAATFENRVLEPGRPISMSLAVTNLTDEPKQVGSHGYLEIRAPDGTLLWTSDGVIGPGEPTRQVGPHQTKEIHPGATTRVRWSGPLGIRPVCTEVGRLRMPSVALDVAVPEPPTSEADAIAASVAYPGSPWQVCPPGPRGEAATGSFDTPDGFPLPPLSLRCWADVRHEAGFDVVSLHLVSPSDLPDFAIPDATSPEEAFFAGGALPGEGNALAVRWTFVVTADGARPVLSQVRSRTVGEEEPRLYLLQNGAWSTHALLSCGYELYGVIQTGRILSLDWITACSGVGAPASRKVLLSA